MKASVGIGAIILLAIFPALALGGMVLIDQEMELDDVTGQNGITINMSMSLTATSIAWGDNDGFTATTAYTTAGWLIYSSVTFPTMAMNSVTMDVGTNGGTSYLAIGTTGNLITGNLTIGSVIVGSSATSSSASLGELRISGMAVSFGTIKISGH